MVGGGLAGLAAAITCADGGATVTLYEARSRLGGATFSFERNGLELDNGQHVALRCCTVYLGFLRRLGVEQLLPLQRRLHVPVLREGRRPALIARNALPTPLHLARTLVLYSPLRLRERLAAARAAVALGKLDPDDAALDEQTFAEWLRAHGQSENAIASLWNVIALPTLNLPAEQASLSAAAKVFRTGLLDSAAACDIGVPAVPFRRLHAEPAAAALVRAGGQIRLGTRVRAVTGDRRLLLDGDEPDEADAVILAVPHESAPALAPPTALDGDALTGLGTSPIVNLHVHYDRAVLERAPRRGDRLAGPVALRPDGGGRGGRGPADRRLALARRRRDRRLGRGAPRALRAGARTAPAGGPWRRGARLRRDARAAGDLPGRSRRTPAPSRDTDAGAGHLPRRRLDGHRLAGDDGGCRPQRPHRGASGARLARRAGMSVTADRALDAGHAALTRARRHLLSLQQPGGWWKGELETNVTIDAEDLFLRHYLGLLDERVAAPTATWIRSRQRPDGSWATYHGGPGDLSTSVEAYVALRLAGDRPDAAHLARAAEFIRDAGGVGQSRVFTRMWLSLLDLWSWGDVPTLPPEQILLPPRAPLSVYSFGCWARQTIVALSVVTALRPAAAVPFAIDELRAGASRLAPADDVWGRAFVLFDRAAHIYGRHPFGSLRRRALRTAERWIVDRQEKDGSWGGIQPPWVWSIVALHALGYPLDHPVLKRGLAGLDTFTISDDEGRRTEACQSPVWDTALAVLALLDAGVEPGSDTIARACAWLSAQEVGTRGDWAVRRPGLAPGGFPFEFANEHYPDVDDTAVIVLALRRAGHDSSGAVGRALDWMLGMQSRSGGFGAFDVDNESRLAAKLAFCDFGAVTDPPSADVTAHVLEDARRRGPRRRAGSRARARLAPAPAGAGRLLVWPLGRELPLRHRRRPAGARRLRPRGPRERHGGGRVARGCPESGRRLRRGPALLPRPELERPRRLDRLPDRLGARRAARGGSHRRRGRDARRLLARRDPASGRRLGRALLHRHRLPRRLLPQLPPLP